MTVDTKASAHRPTTCTSHAGLSEQDAPDPSAKACSGSFGATGKERVTIHRSAAAAPEVAADGNTLPEQSKRRRNGPENNTEAQHKRPKRAAAAAEAAKEEPTQLLHYAHKRDTSSFPSEDTTNGGEQDVELAVLTTSQGQKQVCSDFLSETDYCLVREPFDASKYTQGVSEYDEVNRENLFEATDYVTDIYQRLYFAEVSSWKTERKGRIETYVDLQDSFMEQSCLLRVSAWSASSSLSAR